MISLNTQASVASTSSVSANSQTSGGGSRVFENDNFRFSTHGTEDVSLHNKQSGETHEASGDFGQSQLDGRCHDHQGPGNGMIDKIVQKVIEAVCKALGIDPSEIFGDQPQEGQPPTDGCGPDNPPDSGTGPWGPSPWDQGQGPICYAGGSPYFNESTGQYDMNGGPGGAQNDHSTGPIPDPLGLGSAQNQQDHHGIETVLDPLGIF